MNKFPKPERLRNKRHIEELFQEGVTFTVYPLKVVYLRKPQTADHPNQFLVATPKKNFKKAVDRNKLKRRIREAYRLNRNLLENQQAGFYLLIGYIYVGKEIASYQTIEEKLKQSLHRLRGK